jgi:hypothetical protein
MAEKETANHGTGLVNLSLDIATRQLAFTIDGILIPAKDVFLEKFTFDGEEFISFSYVIESTSDNGMSERRQFFLPRLEDGALANLGELNENGFASKILHNDEKAKADVIDFFSRDDKPSDD